MLRSQLWGVDQSCGLADVQCTTLQCKEQMPPGIREVTLTAGTCGRARPSDQQIAKVQGPRINLARRGPNSTTDVTRGLATSNPAIIPRTIKARHSYDIFDGHGSVWTLTDTPKPQNKFIQGITEFLKRLYHGTPPIIDVFS